MNRRERTDDRDFNCGTPVLSGGLRQIAALSSGMRHVPAPRCNLIVRLSPLRPTTRRSRDGELQGTDMQAQDIATRSARARGSAARSRAYRQRRSTYREPLSRDVGAAIAEALAFVHAQAYAWADQALPRHGNLTRSHGDQWRKHWSSSKILCTYDIESERDRLHEPLCVAITHQLPNVPVTRAFAITQAGGNRRPFG
jgi:hypothetical protein